MAGLFGLVGKVVLIGLCNVIGAWRYALEAIGTRVYRRQLPLSLRTPESRFASLPGYAFDPHYIEIEGFRVHYVEEGPKEAPETIVCLHGEPTWSYLYRKIIGPLANAGHRVVAPDFIGFGKSDKPSDPAFFTHELHLRTVRELFEALDLKNVTLVVQDWGGITGLGALQWTKDRIGRLVILNTAIPPFGGSSISWNRSLNFLLWRSLTFCFGRWLPIEYIMKQAVRGLPSAIAAAYGAPFPNRDFKVGPAKWPLMVPLYRGMCPSVVLSSKSARDILKEWTKPALVMFADKDPVLADLAPYFKKIIPGARDVPSVVISGAGHYLQEDKGEEIAQHILDFLKQ